MSQHIAKLTLDVPAASALSYRTKIGRPHRCGQPVGRGTGHPDRLVLVSDNLHGEHRAK